MGVKTGVARLHFRASLKAAGRAVSVLLLIVQGLTALAAPACAQGGLYAPDVTAALARTPIEEWTRARDKARSRQTDFAVETVVDFVKMNDFYRKFISDGVVVNRFRTATGDEIYCVDVASQAAAVASGTDPKQLLTRPALDSPGATEAGSTPSEQSSIAAAQGLDGSLDDLGRARSCPQGSFPKLIFPIENLYRFRTFEDIFRKVPTGLEPPGSGVTHAYAHAYRSLDNKGLEADFNLWSPAVATPSEFSLSQLWVARGSGSDLQTAETGWQVYAPLYGDNQARLFIYSTSDGYGPSGCYNLMCGRFVQTDSSVVISGAFSNYSTTGGTQYAITLAFIREDASNHHWWLKVGSTWAGYYANNLFDTAGIADKNSILDMGGELINSQTGGVDTQTDMGSGSFPSGGWQNAAFIKKYRYVDMNNVYQNASSLTTSATQSALWDIGAIQSSTDTNWSTFFYFGGPGSVSRPDLAESVVSVPNTAPASNETFPITVSTSNVGAATSPQSTVRYKYSTNSTISTSDPNLNDSDTASALAPSAAEQDTGFVSIAANGTYWVGACVDVVANEIVTSNNCSSGVQISVGSPPCTTFSINPTTVSPTAAAGSQSVSVTGSPTGCQGGNWSASGNGSWITVAPSGGTGSGSVLVSWAQNTSTSPRSGSATVAGHNFSVNQGGLGHPAVRAADFDGDGRSDWVVYRNGTWLYYGPCAHPLSWTGSLINPTCSPCAAAVCNSDSYCCNTQWDAICVNEFYQLCR